MDYLYGVLACNLFSFLYGMRRQIAAAFIVLALSTVLIFASVFSQIDSPRCVSWCWSALAVFLFCVYFVANKDYPFKGLLVRLGDASYSVYLTHGFFTSLTGGFLKKVGAYSSIDADALIVVLTLAIVCICIKAYAFVEKPI